MQNECPGCAVKRGAEPDKTAALCSAHNAAYEQLRKYRGKNVTKKEKSSTRKSKETPLDSGAVPGHVPHGIVVNEFAPVTAPTKDADDAMPWEEEDEPAAEPAAEPAPPAGTTMDEPPRGTSGRVLKVRAPNERLHRPRDAKRMIERFAAEASVERWDWQRMGADPSVVGGLLARLLDLGKTLSSGGSGGGKLVEGATIRAKANSELAEVWQAMYGVASARVIKVTRNEARQLKCLAVDIDGIPLAVFGAQLRQIELATAEDEDEAS